MHRVRLAALHRQLRRRHSDTCHVRRVRQKQRACHSLHNAKESKATKHVSCLSVDVERLHVAPAHDIAAARVARQQVHLIGIVLQLCWNRYRQKIRRLM
jgi:hypothetical protein